MEKNITKVGSCTPAGELKMDQQSALEYYERELEDINEIEDTVYEQPNRKLELADFCQRHELDHQAYELYRSVFGSISWMLAEEINLEGEIFGRALHGLSSLLSSNDECVWEQASQVVGDYNIWKRSMEEKAAKNRSRLHTPKTGFYETAPTASNPFRIYSIYVALCNEQNTDPRCGWRAYNLEENKVRIPLDNYEGLGFSLMFETHQRRSLPAETPITVQLFALGNPHPLFTTTVHNDDEPYDADQFLHGIRLEPGNYYLFIPDATPIGYISQFCHESDGGTYYEFKVTRRRKKECSGGIDCKQ